MKIVEKESPEFVKKFDKLYGRRILHVLSPVRFDGVVFNHQSDSNYKVAEKTIDWLPNCHHYLLLPENHKVIDNRKNVTLLKYKYPTNAVTNRSTFDTQSFLKSFNIKQIDFDFLFIHQPELLYNVLMSIMDKRYGEIVHRFSFFHWVDCNASRGSPAIIPNFMRQLEAINLSTKVFMHTDVSIDPYLVSNFSKDRSVLPNLDYIREKLTFMPLSSHLPSKSVKIQDLTLDKKLVIFNHRWNQSTGINKFIEYTKDLTDEYQFVLTDSNAEDYPDYCWKPKKPLSSEEYRYLLEKSLCTVCFVDGYMTWNLSVQDAILVGKPSLVWKHPSKLIDKVLGGQYPYTFSTKEDFAHTLRTCNSDGLSFGWKLPKHDDDFKKNLITAMEECIEVPKHVPKDAPAWAYYISKGVQFKSEICEQVQPNLQLNGVWQYIRRWLLANGITDDPNCPVTKYSVCDEKVVQETVKDLDLPINPKLRKQTVVTEKHNFF